jgi:hypothetical protein
MRCATNPRQGSSPGPQVHHVVVYHNPTLPGEPSVTDREAARSYDATEGALREQLHYVQLQRLLGHDLRRCRLSTEAEGGATKRAQREASLNRAVNLARGVLCARSRRRRASTWQGTPFIRSAEDEIVQTSVFPFWSGPRAVNAGWLPADHDKPVANAKAHRALLCWRSGPETSVENSQVRPAFRCSRPSAWQSCQRRSTRKGEPGSRVFWPKKCLTMGAQMGRPAENRQRGDLPP